ncbi:lipopolysaccharide transport periplasmic protein LptA [Undibacterium luofuense]|uniref:Lipopolysaccharide transport periplasmic protein LptA n=1 Tax=Undibacterium luofuense TaxID=2828733 RepID=A0A941DIW8_9BURK|nr:lipopolysaccharide transport periplasmic protein LptA [Undibacterium luofuense]MBR7780884.1 lipopolysaccharide transport periplasmic protein LptA [Undibacterium luofuense]
MTIRLRRWLRCLLPVSMMLLTLSSHAEKGDKYKEIVATAGNSRADLKKNVLHLTQGVEISQGSLVIKANNAVMSELSDGSTQYLLNGVSGTKMQFRQKMDGGNRWIEGEAEKATFNSTSGMVILTGDARVRNLDSGKVTQEQNGEYLSYDTVNEVFVSANSTSGQHDASKPKVRIVIQSKLTPPAE